MTGFSAGWLALREPFDRVAREAAAPALDVRALALRLRAGQPALAVLDLACGTGANLRALAPRLGGAQRWLLLDHDPLLLAALPAACAAWARADGLLLRADPEGLRIDGPDWSAEVRVQCIDLARSLDALPFAPASLVTASALLDLVSASWLEALLERIGTAGAAALFALSVDGRLAWEPGRDGDAAVHRLFAAHQRRDKGFGTALGGAAADFAAARFAAMGYAVALARSDWTLDARAGQAHLAMLRSMLEGTAAAALAQDPAARAEVDGWLARRQAAVERSRLRVGHLDLLASPRGMGNV